jgi:hypothetical protein
MEFDDNEAGAGLDQQSFNATQSQSAGKPRGIAPVWHTVILILAIIAVSFLGVHRHPGGAGIGATNRLRTYGVTACLELVLMGWVLFGIRLKGVPLRSIIGKASSDLRSIALDVGIAALFWIGSLMALATVALMWFSIQTAITHKPIPIQPAHGSQPTIPKPADDESARAVVQLAPANGKEVACWLLLCALVGFAEELVFRGYFQSQFRAWARGAAWAGVVFSALMFGAAHGYEGVRAMFLLSLFGAFFSLLALFRRNLRAGMFAHSWHDAVAGLTVALLHARHVL